MGLINSYSDVAAKVRYTNAFNGLSGKRQTEIFNTGQARSPIAARWFDSFTNNTSSTIVANIVFSGDLGTDTRDFTYSASGNGYLVTQQTYSNGTPYTDATVLFIYSDAAHASQVQPIYSLTSDEVEFRYTVTVDPGKTASILSLSYVIANLDRYSDLAAAYVDESNFAVELALAATTNLDINNPIFSGLTADQIASLVNFGIINVDPSLPIASAGARLASNSLSLFNSLLDINQSFKTTGVRLAGSDFAPMAYVPLEKSGGSSEGAAQLAQLISQSGGRLTAGNDQHQLFMLGGLTRGSDRITSEKMEYHGYALALGYEIAADNTSTYGIVAGYMNTSADIGDVYSDISSEQFLISPYARWTLDSGISFDARMSLSSDNWSYIRTAGVSQALASYDGYSLGASIKASKAFEADFAIITPFAKIAFLHNHFNAYEETNAGTANLNIPSYGVNAFDTLAGLGIAKSWMLGDEQQLNTYANVGLGKGFGHDKIINTSYAASSLNYATSVEASEEFYANIDLGASIDLSRNTDLMLSYSGSFTHDSNQHSISSKLSVRF